MRITLFQSALLALITVVLPASPATAGVIGLSEGFTYCVGAVGPECEVFQDGVRVGDQSSPYGLAPLRRSGSYDTEVLDVSFSGRSSPNFGRYRSEVSASFSGTDAPYSFLLFGAGSLDRLILFDPVENLTYGRLKFTWTIDGSMSAATGRVRPQLYIRTCASEAGSIPLIGPFSTENCDLGLFNTPIDSYVTSGIRFAFREPFDLRIDFLTFARYFAGTGSGSAALDYFNTVTLTGIEVLTEDGIPVVGTRFEAESGTSYSASGVPEPAPLLLVAVGVAGVLARKRLRGCRVGVAH